MCKLIKGHYYFYVKHVDLSNVFLGTVDLHNYLPDFQYMWMLCSLIELKCLVALTYLYWEREKRNQSVIKTSLYQRWYSVCLESTPAASHCAVVYSVKDRNYSLHILFCSSSKKCFPLNYYLLFFVITYRMYEFVVNILQLNDVTP